MSGSWSERRRARTAIRLAYELAAGVAIGLATVFTSKPQQDMHWSIPPTFKVLNLRLPDEMGDSPAAR